MASFLVEVGLHYLAASGLSLVTQGLSRDLDLHTAKVTRPCDVVDPLPCGIF